ncbi:MAG: tannase/feruloyl esterase family alpha/beta hydrolase, partial [Novosphingobium sp.]
MRWCREPAGTNPEPLTPGWGVRVSMGGSMNWNLISAAVLLALASPVHAQAATGAGRCDEAVAEAFSGDGQVSIVLTKSFAAGDTLLLSGDASPQAPKLAHDLCLVKLIVGPGNPGPAGAPSTTQGIGIEIWLPSPARWDGRIHALGGGGFQGGAISSPDHVGSPMSAMVTDSEGAVSSTADAGHASEPRNYGIPDSGGDFLMLPDGSPNRISWQDFAVRAIHEQAVRTRQLTQWFYGRPAAHVYFDGSSTGGRQGHKLAQVHPEDYDGIIANLPALHWTRMLPAMVYPHLVYQRDLGGKPLSIGQLDLVSNAAIAACDMVGGEHLGYMMDPGQCRYDPTRDKAVLCKADGGANETADCVSRLQARAMNKIWYGPTVDGSVPDPARDNGWRTPPRGKHVWYGPARGTSLWNAFFFKFLGRATGVASPEQPPFLGTHQLALNSGDPALAGPDFSNAKSNGRDGWKALSYAQLAQASRRGRMLNGSTFAEIDTDNPDLSALEARGTKLLAWQGTNDEVIPIQGTMLYYDSVVRKLGGLARVQKFYRFYVVPGAGHQSPNGTSNEKASPPIFSRTGIYEYLVNGVENGQVPGRIDLSSPDCSRSQPVCP